MQGKGKVGECVVMHNINFLQEAEKEAKNQKNQNNKKGNDKSTSRDTFDENLIVTGKQIGRASCRERV